MVADKIEFCYLSKISAFCDHVCICTLIDFTFENPVLGNFSQASLVSSPDFPFLCPLKMRAIVPVWTPRPSPTKRITFLATLVFKGDASMCCRSDWPEDSQKWASGERERRSDS